MSLQAILSGSNGFNDTLMVFIELPMKGKKRSKVTTLQNIFEEISRKFIDFIKLLKIIHYDCCLNTFRQRNILAVFTVPQANWKSSLIKLPQTLRF